MATSRWTLPCNSQTESILGRFPPEIRLLILRYSLRQPNVWLDTEEDVQRMIDISVGHKLMETCQLLYEEGERLFYSENTLDIEVMYDGNAGHPIFTMKSNFLGFTGEVYVDVDTFCPLPPDFTLESESFHLSFHEVGNVPILGWKRDRLAQVIMKCQKIRIDVNTQHHNNRRVLAAICRMLEPLVRDGKLEIDYDLGGLWEAELYPCRWLRCASLKINTRRAPEEVANFIKSWRPYSSSVDHYKDWHHVYKRTIVNLPLREINGHETRLVDHWVDKLQDIETAALNCDSASMMDHFFTLDKLIFDWSVCWWEEESKRLQRARRLLRDYVQQSDGIVDRLMTQRLSERVTDATKIRESNEDIGEEQYF